MSCDASRRARAWSRFQSGLSRVFCRPSTPDTRRTLTGVAVTTLRTAATQAAARTASTCSTRATPVATARQSRPSTTSTPLELLHLLCTSRPVSRPASSCTLHTTNQLLQLLSNPSLYSCFYNVAFCLVIVYRPHQTLIISRTSYEPCLRINYIGYVVYTNDQLINPSRPMD